MIGFIVNPVSGGGNGMEQWKHIEQECRQRRIPYKVSFTNYEGHGIILAREAAKDPNLDIVIAIGGDGTVNEVANGLYQSTIPLGYIPSGTGNDFARAMEIPTNPIQALSKILEGNKFEMDIVSIRGRKYVNVAGIGFDGQVALTTNQSKYKSWLGKWGYFISVFRVLFTYKPSKVMLTIDDRTIEFDHVWLIAVANIPYYGGGMKICPSAKWNDQQLDLCIVSQMSRFKLLLMFPLVFSGKHMKLKEVKMMSGKNIEIRTTEPLQIHADGELLGQTPVDIQLEPVPLTIIL